MHLCASVSVRINGLFFTVFISTAGIVCNVRQTGLYAALLWRTVIIIQVAVMTIMHVTVITITLLIQ